MSDLTASEFITTSPGNGGSNLVVESFVDSADALTKVLPSSSVYWGTKGGDYFLVNETTPLPCAVFADGVALETATTDPGASDPGLIVRVAGVVNQGDAAAISDAWMTKLTNGTVAATLTTVSSKNCLDVNIVAGAGSGTAMIDDAAFTPGTTSITPVGGTYRATRDAVNDGDAGCFAMTINRAEYVSIETPLGDSVLNDTWNSVVHSDAFPASTTGSISTTGTTTSVACSGLGAVSVSLTGTASAMDFTFEASNDGGTSWGPVSAVRRDTNEYDLGPTGLALSSETVIWQVDVKGLTHFRLNVSLLAAYAAVDYVVQPIAGEFATSPPAGANSVTQYDEDTAHVSGDSGTPTLVVRKDAMASTSGTDGDYSMLQVTSRGSLRTNDEAANGSYLDEVTNVLVEVLTDPLKLTYLSVENTNVAKCFLQIFDNADAGTITLGTDAPKWSFPIGPSGVQEFLVPLRFASGLVIAVTTTWDGLTAPSAAVLVNAAYIS